MAETGEVKLFYTGMAESADLLVVMLEKHGIMARQEFADEAAADDPEGLNRTARVLVEEKDYPRAHQLFYAEREDEL